MHATLFVSTDLFEHREARPHATTAGGLGEDFAVWLLHRLTPDRLPRFTLGEPIQEHYGWGFRADAENRDSYWVALSYGETDPVSGRAEWVVTIAYDPGFNPIRRLFHRPNPAVFGRLRRVVWETMHAAPGIAVTGEE